MEQEDNTDTRLYNMQDLPTPNADSWLLCQPPQSQQILSAVSARVLAVPR